MPDVHHAISAPDRIEPHHRRPVFGGTCWRLFGRDINQESEIAVGIEAFLHKGERRVVLCTVFDPNAEEDSE